MRATRWCSGRFEQLRRDLALLASRRRARPRLGREDRRHLVEELRIRGDSIFSIRANAIDRSLPNGVPATDLEHVAAEIERAQLAEREAGLEALQHLAVQVPARTALLVLVVVEREAGFLQRRQIAADRARGDVEVLGQASIDDPWRDASERVQHLPLADDFLIAGHRLAAFLGARAARAGGGGRACRRPGARRG